MLVESRRNFLRLSLGLVFASAVGFSSEACGEQGENQTSPYNELRSFRDKEIPSDLVLRIGQDLVASPQYPSLVQAGRLLIENQQDPQKLSSYDPYLINPSGPIKVAFSNLGNNVALLQDVGILRVTDAPISLTKRVSAEKVYFLGAQKLSTDLTIILNNGLIAREASPEVFKLMVAKETSHIVYFSKAREELLNNLKEIYEVDSDQVFENTLMSTALSALDPRFSMPFVSRFFNGSLQFIDYAGYGHIALDLGKIKEEGGLSENDKRILSLNLTILDEALARGVIIQDANDNTKFTWAENASPFSIPWFDVMNTVYGRLGFRTVYNTERQEIHSPMIF